MTQDIRDDFYKKNFQPFERWNWLRDEHEDFMREMRARSNMKQKCPGCGKENRGCICAGSCGNIIKVPVGLCGATAG